MTGDEITKKEEELSPDFKQDNMLLGEQMQRFLNAFSPYSIVSSDRVMDCLESNPEEVLNTFRFISIKEFSVENKEEIDEHLQQKMSKFFMAMHPIGAPIIYGLISIKGKTNIVIGVQNKDNETLLKSVLNGMLTGAELEELNVSVSDMENPCGGIISAVPVSKVNDEQQYFDISALMRCMSGNDYTVLFIAHPYKSDYAGQLYADVLDIRDKCAVISKRNVSRQKSASRAITDTVADTKSHTFSAIVYNYSTSKNTSQSIADTIGSSETISYDAQNGLALELLKYCDKAIERIKGAINTGLWGVTICYSAKDELHASIIGACLTGELSRPSEDILPSMRFNVRKNKKSLVDFPIIGTGKKNDLMAPISSNELGIICMPPIDSAPDFEIREEKIYPMISLSSDGDGVTIGRVTDGHRPIPSMEFALSESDLNKHTFVCGITGSGKTTTVKGILSKTKKPFMVIESAKKEYRNIKLDDNRDIFIYTIGKPEINCPQFNPFYVQKGISLQTHIDYLKDLFNASFSFYGPMTYILEKCLYNIYINKGWNITFGYHPYLVNTNNPAKVFDAEYMQERYSMQGHKYLFPTMQDLKDEVERYIKNEMDYDGEVAGNIKSAMLARLESLCVGSKGFMFNTSSFLDVDSLMKENAVFELEGLADDSDKAFCVGLFIIFVNEYRQISKEESGNNKVDLQHLLVIEEAHRLLKNVDTERGSEEMGNPKGKAVEHFTNMIAEMRSYGQGVIIAEQIPSKLAPEVIKNTSNKIIQRVVSSDDQKLIANTVGIKEEDALHLGILRTGMGLCHKEGMNLPVYVKVDPINDNYISDDMLLLKRQSQVFEDVNMNVIKSELFADLDEYALKIINSVMVDEKKCIIDNIKNAKTHLVKAITRNDIRLIACRNRESLIGKVLAERIGCMLTYGVYGVKDIVDDAVVKAIGEMLQGDIDVVDDVKSYMRKKYGTEDLKGFCVFIISELLKREYSTDVNIEKSVAKYFVKADSAIADSVKNKMRKGVE